MKQGLILLCMGTRPEIIKMAPVYHAMREVGLPAVALHTGQHEDLAWPFYEFFGVEPCEALDLQRRSGSLGHLGARLLETLSDAMERIEPALVLVHGDTSSAFMAAVAAFYHKIPVGHVEAGLRTHEPYDPFPEEKNREIIARLAHWHFAPTAGARANLLAEGVRADRVFVVGNTVVDAARWGVEHIEHLPHDYAAALSPAIRWVENLPAGCKVLLITAHRRENWGAGIASIAQAAKDLLVRYQDMAVIWPVHANPAVSAAVREGFADLPESAQGRLLLCEPLSYPGLLWALKACWLVLTDSGGIQEEAAALNKPVLVLRDSTERPELISSGGGVLVGTERSAIVAQVRILGGDGQRYRRMCTAANPFGDGRSGTHICDVLVRELRLPTATPLVPLASCGRA